MRQGPIDEEDENEIIFEPTMYSLALDKFMQLKAINRVETQDSASEN